VKKIQWFLAITVVLVSTLSTPIRLHADGNPTPTCPNSKSGCKPLEQGGFSLG
jgi:hypothetical protein